MSAQRGKLEGTGASAPERRAAALAGVVGNEIRAERRRRGLTLIELAAAAGVSVSVTHGIESGRPARLETYVRLACALRLRLAVDLIDPHRREPGSARAEDPVHASMGEIEAARLRSFGYAIGVDEPFQHFQFSGRADLVAWSLEQGALLHIENRTRFPNLQEAFGSFNAKRAYLGNELAERVGRRRWQSETHVMVALSSAEVLHELRLHRSTFEGVLADEPDAFDRWWDGQPPQSGSRTALVIFDPIGGGPGRPRWVGLADLATVKPRYRGYAEALDALREAGLA